MEKLNPEYANYNDTKCGCFYNFIKCCFKSTFEASIDTVLKAINLTTEQKRIIRKRYVTQVVYYEEISNKINSHSHIFTIRKFQIANWYLIFNNPAIVIYRS